MTITIDTDDRSEGFHAEIARIWIDEVEVTTTMTSIPRWLNTMEVDGWSVKSKKIAARGKGATIIYKFGRSQA